MAVSGTRFYMNDSNAETFNTLKKQLAGVMGSSSTDLEDLCVSSLANKWAARRARPIKDAYGNDVKFNAYTEARVYTNEYTGTNMNRVGDMGNVKLVNRDANGGGYIQAMGFDIPYVDGVQVGSYEGLSTIISRIADMKNSGSAYNWPVTPWSREGGYKRIRDFDDYNHKAVFPFRYTINATTVYLDGSVEVSWSFYQYNENVNIMDLFKYAFGDACVFAAVVATEGSSNFNLVASTQPMSQGAGWFNISNSIIQANRLKRIYAYFVAFDSAKKRAILLPYDSTYPNPLSFTVSEYVSTDILTKLKWPLISDTANTDTFGYDNNTGAANMIPLRQASPSGGAVYSGYAPVTTGSFIFSVTLSNPTSSAITFAVDNLRVFVNKLNTSSANVNLGKPTVYNSSMTNISGTNVTIAANGTLKLYLKVSNIWAGGTPTASDSTLRNIVFGIKYYASQYENYGYPSMYSNVGEVPMWIVYPATSSNNGKVARFSSGSITSIVNYSAV